jgi:hypothetical protein
LFRSGWLYHVIFFKYYPFRCEQVKYVIIVYDMIYLTAVGLTPGGSSIHLHTKQYIEQHNQSIHRTTHYPHKTIHGTTQFTN